MAYISFFRTIQGENLYKQEPSRPNKTQNIMSARIWIEEYQVQKNTVKLGIIRE